MAMYSYRAMDESGAITNGFLPALNPRELESRLQTAGLELIRFKPIRRSFLFRTNVPPRELFNFCIHLETTLNAGLIMTEALEDQVESIDHKAFRDVLIVVLQAVREGTSLSNALRNFPDVFNEVFVGMVYSGEESGRLSEAFGKLGEYLRWQDELASQTRRMIMYPAFTITVLVAVTVFVLVYLVPDLAMFIRSMGNGQLPLPTLILVQMSEFLRSFWLQLLVAPLFIWAFVVAFLRIGGAVARQSMDAMRLRIPLVGPILKKVILSRFCTLLSMLYESGVPVIQAIQVARDAVGNREIASSITLAVEEIQKGKGITEAFKTTDLFNNLMLRLIRVGEVSGEVEKGLRNISYFYNRDIQDAITRFQAMAEPIVTLALGILLGALMMSVLGPIYDLLGAVGA